MKKITEIYQKQFIRDFSLVNIQLWYRAESKNKKHWTNKKQVHQPYIVFERKNNLVTVYYSQKGLKWVESELKRKIKEEKNFFKIVEKGVEEKIKPILKAFGRVCLGPRTKRSKIVINFISLLCH